jgi:flagellar biosynthesis protein FlhB
VSDASKSHKPTPKRQREFRKRGEIAHSRDLTAAATLLAGTLALAVSASMVWAALCGAARVAASGEGLGAVAASARHAFTVAVAPVLAVAVAAALIAGAVQLGWPPVLRWPKVDFSRPFTFGGLAGALSPKAAAGRLAAVAVKVVAIGAAVTAVLASDGSVLSAADAPDALIRAIGAALLKVTVVAAMVFGALAAVDFVKNKRAPLMSSDEIRREMRESEGDPMLKARRRRRMRELAKRRVIAETRKADVILVNPTHYAVALRYRAADGGAPRVVAKGTDELAARIREAARAAGVPVISRPPLARALWKLVPEGQEIPSQLYHAVAEVLAYIYRLRDRRVGRPA